MVLVNKEQIQQCYDFAVNAWKYHSQSQRQFGTQGTRKREEFIADQTLGKLAEYVFKNEIEEKSFNSVKVKLNFNHYLNPLHTDDGDVEIYKKDIFNDILFPFRIDIKGSSYKSQWLLVEEHKFIDLQTKKPMSDYYVKVKFDDRVPDNPTLRKNPEQILELEAVNGYVEGWARWSDFISQTDNEPWFIFKRGDRPWRRRVLPNLNKINNLKHLNNSINYRMRNNDISYENATLDIKLDAEKNIGLPIKELRADISELLEISNDVGV